LEGWFAGEIAIWDFIVFKIIFIWEFDREWNDRSVRKTENSFSDLFIEYFTIVFFDKVFQKCYGLFWNFFKIWNFLILYRRSLCSRWRCCVYWLGLEIESHSKNRLNRINVPLVILAKLIIISIPMFEKCVLRFFKFCWETAYLLYERWLSLLKQNYLWILVNYDLELVFYAFF
jgi:hypothetical protein